jgi:hypothetical protein
MPLISLTTGASSIWACDCAFVLQVRDDLDVVGQPLHVLEDRGELLVEAS